MMAVIEASGKQYLVSPGANLTIDKLSGAVGDQIAFDKVLLLADEEKGTVQVGTPYVSGASVPATVVKQGRAKKITVIKFKAKVRYRRKQGHRQLVTSVRIGEIK